MWKSSDTVSEPPLMESVIVDVPKKEITELEHILVGNNVKVTGDFKHDLDIDLTDKDFLIIDYYEDYNEKGKHVHLVSNDESSEKQKLYDKLRKLFPDISIDDMEKVANEQPLKKKQYLNIMKKLNHYKMLIYGFLLYTYTVIILMSKNWY